MLIVTRFGVFNEWNIPLFFISFFAYNIVSVRYDCMVGFVENL